MKINFDGSKSPLSAVEEFVLQSGDGRFLHAEAFNLGVALILVAETTIIRNGVCAVVRVGYNLVVFEEDNQLLN